MLLGFIISFLIVYLFYLLTVILQTKNMKSLKKVIKYYIL